MAGIEIRLDWRRFSIDETDHLRLQSGIDVHSVRDGAQTPSLHTIFAMDEPSANRWPWAQVIVHDVELHETFEFRGTVGLVKHSFFSCSQYGPTKLSGHEHSPGWMQMPLFLHCGTQIATQFRNEKFNE